MKKSLLFTICIVLVMFALAPTASAFDSLKEPIENARSRVEIYIMDSERLELTARQLSRVLANSQSPRVVAELSAHVLADMTNSQTSKRLANDAIAELYYAIAAWGKSDHSNPRRVDEVMNIANQLSEIVANINLPTSLEKDIGKATELIQKAILDEGLMETTEGDIQTGGYSSTLTYTATATF